LLGTSSVVSTEASSGLKSEKCEVGDLAAVFKEPLRYDGQLFCGRAFVYFERELLAFYERRIAADDRTKYDTALLPTDLSRSKSEALASMSGQQAMLRARLKVERFCEVEVPKHPGYACTPIKHPIYASELVYSPIP
jgi:hypothetical protein